MKTKKAEFGGQGYSSLCRIMAFVLVCYVLTAPGSVQALDVLMSPQVAQLELRPGSRSVVTFELTNQERDLILSVKVFAMDSYQGAHGEYKLSDSALPYSCVDWLVLPDTVIEIEPGRTRQVAVGVEVPSKAVGGAYGAVVFEFVPAAGQTADPGAMATRFDYRFQVPSWLEITVKRATGARRMLVPGDISVTPTSEIPDLKERFGDRGLRISIDAENTGNIHVFTQGRLIIRDENRRLVRDTRMGGGRGLVLPGTKVALRSIVEAPKPGKYTLKTFIDYGGRSPAIAQTTFEITADKKSSVGSSEVAMPLYLEYRPEIIESSIPAGGFRTFAVNMMNREAAPVAIDVQLAGLTFTDDGQIWIPEEETEIDRSCTPWLTVDPPQFTLDANRRQNMRVSLAVPDTASGGYYACIILNAYQTADSVKKGLASPVYIPVYVTVPPNIELGGKIVAVNTEQGAGDISLNVKFQNTGNIHEIVVGRANIQKWVEPEAVEGIEVVDTARFENLVSFALLTDSTYILPGKTRLISSQSVQGLAPGRYRAEVIVRYGGKEPAKKEHEFFVD